MILTVSGTFAYWNPSVTYDEKAVTLNINFGVWDFEEIKENYGFVDFFEDIEFLNHEHPYQTLIKGKLPSEYEVLVIYYPPTGLYYKLDLTKNPSTCYPYNSNTGCKTPDISDPYNNPYEQLQLQYLSNIKYPQGSDVLYNGKYYLKMDNNQTAPGAASYNNWEVSNKPYDPNKTYKVNDRVVVNGLLFIANEAGVLAHPESYTGQWNLKTYDYVTSNTYRSHDVVLYNGKYYYALFDNIKNISPDHETYWKLAG